MSVPFDGKTTDGVFVWNNLPKWIKDKYSLEEFKKFSPELISAHYAEFCINKKTREEYDRLSPNVKGKIKPEVYEILPQYIKQKLLEKKENFSAVQLDTISKLPWSEKNSFESVSLDKAAETLGKSHLGLKDVKHRVLRYIACQKHLGNTYGTVLLFCGPAGVGKTSIVRSVADAMGRRLVKISLAGVSDADVLKGTSAIYSNSRQGRIVDAVISSQSFSPIILLDEVDKIARGNANGDPQYALLDILDSDRSNFIDECLGFSLDLSNVIFIATANDKSKITPILLDRFEIVEITGYTEEEKIEIVKDYVLPELFQYYKLNKDDIYFTDSVIKYIIKRFSKEPGIRKVKNVITQIFEEIVYRIEMKMEYNKQIEYSDINEIFNLERIKTQKRKYYNIHDIEEE